MPTDQLANLVVMEINQLLAEDGGHAELLTVDEGVARVRYQIGSNDECPECVMSADEMESYIADAMKMRAPHIRSVAVVTA